MPKKQTHANRRRRLVGAAAAQESTEAVEARAIRRERVAELLAQHKTYRQIAAEIGCAFQTVAEDRQAIIAEYRERYRDAAEDMIEQETSSLEQMESQALAVFRESGDVRALEAALKCKARKHALRGLDKPFKLAPTNPEGDEEFSGVSDEALEKQLRKLTGGAA